METRNIKNITRCRICGNEELSQVIDLGIQALTGVFPREGQDVPLEPLALVRCNDAGRDDACGLLQLAHSPNLSELYGSGYGYRSGLNASMSRHLNEIVKTVLKWNILEDGDAVIDIGSNDGTLLASYPQGRHGLIGIDPSGAKFKEHYPAGAELITDFFSAKTAQRALGSKRAKVVTSIAMFYDLEDPLDFMKNVHEVLDENGIWVFEQSYMPLMLERNAYDTICHEHLEYYGLKQIQWMMDKVGFRIIDMEQNDTNGGSICITAAKTSEQKIKGTGRAAALLDAERKKMLETKKPYEEFKRRVFQHRDDLIGMAGRINKDGKRIFGYGASTKGNVILQFCGFGVKDIPCIAEINEDKFGRFTPGTRIPIVSEKDARLKQPDYLLVLPWHFRDHIINRESDYLDGGGKLFFPLPIIDVVSR